MISRRLTRGLAIASFALLMGQPGASRADEIGTGEIVVPPEPEPVAPPPPEPVVRRPCCTVWPLGYFDETVEGMQDWLRQIHLDMNTGLSTSFQWDFSEPAGVGAGVADGASTVSSRPEADDVDPSTRACGPRSG